MKKILFLTILTILSGKSIAQCTVSIVGDTLVCVGDQKILNADVIGPKISLDASNTAGNNHRGNMFDIVATNDVRIISFDVSPMGNTTIEIYYKAGSWNGFANTPSAWTFIGSAPVAFTGGFSPVDIPINVHIPSGETYAFYITSNNTGVSLNYSNGITVGNIYSSDANIAFIEGGGMEYPFTQGTGAVYQPRVWNGRINYALDSVPVTYLWNTLETTNSIETTITAPAQFTVESTIAGCPTLTDTLDVNVSVPAVSAGANQNICLGDTLLLFGTGAVSYTWDNGVLDSLSFVPALSGTTTYTVTGTDTIGCIDIATVDVTVHELPNINAGEDQNVCLGFGTTLSASGANSYIWDNGVQNSILFIPIATAEYIVTGTDTYGCTGFDTVNVSVIPLPTAVVSKLGNILISDSASSYQWINCETNLPVSGANSQLFTVTENGNYAVIIENEYGCADTSACFTISNVGIETLEHNEWNISPNPTNGMFTINTSQIVTNILVEVYSPIGQMVYKCILSGKKIVVNLDDQPNGVYIVKINNEQNFKVVKF